MDFSTYVPKLVIENRTNDKTNEFEKWSSYLYLSCVMPSIDPALCGHDTYFDRSVISLICITGHNICVMPQPDIVRVATVKIVLDNEIRLKYLDGNREIDYVAVDKIVTDEKIICDAKNFCEEILNDYTPFVDHRKLLLHRNYLPWKVYDLVQRGQFFEIQDPNDPATVHIAKVMKVRGPIITAESGTAVFNIHMADVLCHELGWGRKTHEKVKYVEENNINQKVYLESPVPAIIFERNHITQHGLLPGYLVEVLAKDRQTFYYAHVKEIINDHYFTVVSGEYEPADSLIEHMAHRRSTHIFPVGFAASIGYTLQPPNNVNEDVKSKFNWDIYRTMYCPNGVPAENIGALEEPRSKVPTLRYLLHFSYEQGFFSPALIVRAEKGFVWLVCGANFRARAPYIFHQKDLSLFPVCAFDRYSLPFIKEPPLETYPKWDMKDGHRFGLDKKYTSVPTNIFDPSTSEKPFMTKCLLESDSWSPRIYTNLNCDFGPNMDVEAVKNLRKFFEAGSIPSVTSQIFKDLLNCVTKPEKQKAIIACFGNVSEAANYGTMTVKCRVRSGLDKLVLRVPSCKTRQLGGWLRTVTRAMQCCPNVLSLKPIRDDFTCVFCEKGRRLFAMKRRFIVRPIEKTENRVMWFEVMRMTEQVIANVPMEDQKKIAPNLDYDRDNENPFLTDRKNVYEFMDAFEKYTEQRRSITQKPAEIVVLSDDDSSKSNKQPSSVATASVSVQNKRKFSASSEKAMPSKASTDSSILSKNKPSSSIEERLVHGSPTIVRKSKTQAFQLNIQKSVDPRTWNAKELYEYMGKYWARKLSPEAIKVLLEMNVDGDQFASFNFARCVRILDGLPETIAMKLFDIVEAFREHIYLNFLAA
ncbi:unnamed protein product [Caenorhabditis auriculariae]|uniref:SLED domain-containing protein n=1 Tax=Caenorhabditis auriculariae TaxID=2777116 RepID=A0A8S1GRB1_9PELO|nr:unnamed protein product [Caenorhabditis auriculariae]